MFNIITTTRFFFLPKNEILYITYQTFRLISLYYITIASLVQINIINKIPKKNREELNKEEELKLIFKKIENHMIEHEAYMNPTISLKIFAKDIKISERLISKSINTVIHKNFNNYINHYRIERFKKLLNCEKHKKYSIAAIANEVGFNSKTSFYKNFKEIVGVSPSEYTTKIQSTN